MPRTERGGRGQPGRLCFQREVGFQKVEPELASNAERTAVFKETRATRSPVVFLLIPLFSQTSRHDAGNFALNKGKARQPMVPFPFSLSQQQAGGDSTWVKCVHNRK